MALTKTTNGAPIPSPIDPRDAPFGAVFDGVHDDAPAINAAIAYARSAGGGTILLSEGTTGKFAIGAPIVVPASVSIVTLGEVTCVPVAAYIGDAFQFMGGNLVPGDGLRYTTCTYQLPSIIGNFANGLHFMPNTVLPNIDIPYIGGDPNTGAIQSGPVNAVLFDYTNTQGIYGVWLRINQIRFCTTGIKCQGTRNTALPSVLQGAWVICTFIDATTNGLVFTDTVSANGERNYNVIDNRFDILSMDGSGASGVGPQAGAQGITFDKCVYDGGSNFFNCSLYFGNYPGASTGPNGTGGAIVATNGGMPGGWEFSLAPYALPGNDYEGVAGIINVDSHNRVTVNGASGLFARGIVANTAANSRATFNAGAGNGVPIYANRYDVTLNLPAMAAGAFTDFYVYHPLTTGCAPGVSAVVRNSGTAPVFLACLDQSMQFGFGAAHPNEIVIRVFTAAAIGAQAIQVTLTVGL